MFQQASVQLGLNFFLTQENLREQLEQSTALESYQCTSTKLTIASIAEFQYSSLGIEDFSNASQGA